MANHFRLFGRPLMADEVHPPLSVTGTLDGYIMGEAYESRLTINNSVGRCTVEVLQDSNLPPGATVRVDNITKEVVLKWPVFQIVEEELTSLPNGDFEQGDDGTWTLGPGWSIGTGSEYETDGGAYSARFANVKTKGSDLVSPMIPAKVNDYIVLKARVQQGASSKGNAGARVWLTFHDATGVELSNHPGNLVTSGKNGNWNYSTAEGAAPANTAGVLAHVAAYRNKQNHPLWVDNVTWNHKYTLGQDQDEDYFLSIRVTDSENRTALWSGFVGIYTEWLTSGLYPLGLHDGSVSTSFGTLSFTVKVGSVNYDDSDLVLVPPAHTLSFGLRSNVIQAGSVEVVTVPASQVLSFSLKSSVVSYATPPERVSVSVQAARAFSVKTVAIAQVRQEPAVLVNKSTRGFSLT